jgi:hypothetical protein
LKLVNGADLGGLGMHGPTTVVNNLVGGWFENAEGLGSAPNA